LGGVLLFLTYNSFLNLYGTLPQNFSWFT
jgi:hypothetical protein